MDNISGQCIEQAKKFEGEIVSFLRGLIEIPSQSAEEELVVKRIYGEMEKLGYEKITVDGLGNIIGKIGNGRIKILFDSHIDTVGAGDIGAWKFDPYKGKVENGVVYGRGASDNKGATAAMVYGGHIMKKLGLLDGVTLYVVGTVMEEDCDGLGLKYAIEEGQLEPDYVVLGECTNLDIYRGHRGRMEISVHVQGKSCHASAPERGENPLYTLAPVLLEIEKLNTRLKHDQFLGKGSIAVTDLKVCTGSFNTVPDSAVAYLDRRLTAGEDRELALSEVREVLKTSRARAEVLIYDRPSYKGKVVKMEKNYPTWTLPEEHPLVQAGSNTASSVLGKKPEISKWVFSTNGVASMGLLGIPTIGFGPSEEKFAHTTDDQVSIDHLVKASVFYAVFPEFLKKMILH